MGGCRSERLEGRRPELKGRMIVADGPSSKDVIAVMPKSEVGRAKQGSASGRNVRSQSAKRLPAANAIVEMWSGGPSVEKHKESSDMNASGKPACGSVATSWCASAAASIGTTLG